MYRNITYLASPLRLTLYWRGLDTYSFAHRRHNIRNTYWRLYFNPGIYFNNLCFNIPNQERKYRLNDGQYSK